MVLTAHVNYLLKYLRDLYTLVEWEVHAAGIPTGGGKGPFLGLSKNL